MTGPMASHPSPGTSLSTAELQALVQQLRQELAHKEQQIAELRSQLAQVEGKEQASDAGGLAIPQPASEEPPPGSQEDLFAQLDQLYQEK